MVAHGSVADVELVNASGDEAVRKAVEIYKQAQADLVRPFFEYHPRAFLVEA